MLVKNGTGVLTRVLTCPPTDLRYVAPINQISNQYANLPVDQAKVMAEYQALLAVYQAEGIRVEELTPADNMSNSVFARDFGGCVKEGYILGRFRKPIRFSERTAYAQKMAALGIPKLFAVEKGYFEGGDFAFLNEDTIAIGTLDRTDHQGFLEIKAGLADYGYHVVEVPAKSTYLHLDMCFNLVDDHLAVAYLQGLPNAFKNLLQQLDIEVIPVSEAAIFKHGCNLQSLGAKRVISLAQNTQVNEALAAHGMQVIPVAITELLKAGGGPHCMTFPLHRI